MFKHNIVINKISGSHYYEGSVESFYWHAKVVLGEACEGIDAETLEKGEGKVVKLCLYKIEETIGGNPNMPAMNVKRIIYANYDDGWTVLNESSVPMIKELVQYLERRSYIKAVK